MYLAIDIGGTKTLFTVFNQDGEITEQIKFPTPEIYEDFLAELTKNIGDLNNHDFSRVVVAVPGRIDREEGIAIAFGNRNWENVPIGPDIEKILNCPVRLENDAKLAALSEANLLLPDYTRTLYITISTGIGAGYIVDGKIPPEHEDMEAGQMLLEYLGKLTDWEDFGSGRAFQKKFGMRVSDTPDDNTEAWYWLARNIAIGLIDLCAVLTPQIIVIGGGAGAHLDKFYDRLVEEMKVYENPLFAVPPIVAAKHAENSVIYGCFELAKQHAA